MYSAGNYLNKLGWATNEPIIQHVTLPADFDRDLINGDTKKSLTEWSALGVMNMDGTPINPGDATVGIVADTKAIAEHDLYKTDTDDTIDTDVAPTPVIRAYLTYPNFYRIKKWNNSSWYAIAIGELSEKLK